MRLGNLFFLPSFILISTLVLSTNCWESYELDLFDLVEEIGTSQNFYEVFDVSRNSDQNEIKKAYRKLSLLWHPDRSSDPDAETKFRHIVAINDVLKDEVKRARYDQILENGMPDWRHGIYYFRRVRKLSTLELSVAISIIISIGHYFVLWAQHFEKKLTLEDRMGEVKKKVEKQKQKKKKNAELDEIDASLQKFYDSLPSPTLKDTLPYRITIWSFKKLINLPFTAKDFLVVQLFDKKKSVTEEKHEIKIDYNSNHKNESERLHLELNPKKIEKSAINAPPLENYEQKQTTNKSDDNLSLKPNKDWSDKDKADLIKALVKFPSGTANRWIKIGEHLDRQAQDCIQMEKQMKSNLNSVANSSLNSASWNQKTCTILNNKEEPTITTRLDVEKSEIWSQEQQALLEKALKEISKDIPNRWDKIADTIPNKTKEDCINRYKILCTTLKKKQQS